MLRAGSADWRSIRSPRRETCAKAVRIHRESAAPRRHHGIGLPASPHQIRPVRRAVGRPVRRRRRSAPLTHGKDAGLAIAFPCVCLGAASVCQRASTVIGRTVGREGSPAGPVPSGAQQRVLVGPGAIVGADARDLSSAHELRLDFASDCPASGRASPTVPLLALGHDQSPGCRAAWARLLRRQDIAPDSDSDPKLAALGILLSWDTGQRRRACGAYALTLVSRVQVARRPRGGRWGVRPTGTPALRLTLGRYGMA